MKNAINGYPLKICDLLSVVLCLILSGCANKGQKQYSKIVAGNEKMTLSQHASRIIQIPGGHYAVPFVINIPDVEYVLDGDITADGTAILINTSKVIVNLNGKTITYNQKVPGEGVAVGAWNKTDIAIINGTIIQGTAMSEGDQYGVGNNPVKTTPFHVDRFTVSNLHVIYGGRDVGGISATTSNSVFEKNIIEDKWTVGTLKNRHQGIDALAGSKHIGGNTNNVYRNNKLINCRHRGITTGNNDIVSANHISINSLATNSYGIFAYAKQHIKIYDNIIFARGEHPIGIGTVAEGTNDIEIFNNAIDVQTTKIGEEYGSDMRCLDPVTSCGNYAVGFRTTWGGDNIRFYDNTIVVRTDSTYEGTISATGKSVVVNGKGRGLMVAINSGQSSKFYNNTITALDKDGSGKAFGIACTGNNAGEMIFESNTVISNILNVALSDAYGFCGRNPLFIRNTFVKTDNYPVYKTVAAELGGYSEGTGRFVSNVYKNGASQDSIEINAGGESAKSIFFGRELTARLLTPNGIPLAEATLKVENGGFPFDSIVKTDVDGKAKLVVYDYELHNTNCKTTQTRKLAPHTIQVVAGLENFATRPDTASSAWDAMAATGVHHLELYKEGQKSFGWELTIFY